MNEYQLDHNEYIHKKKKFPIYLILDNLEDTLNIGGIFRISDAFGIEKIFICCSNLQLINQTTLKKTARGTEKYVEYEVCQSVLECIKKLKEVGVIVLALEITNKSVSINSYGFSSDDKYAFVVGNEKYGVSQEVLNIVDSSVHINMYGNNSSMNVATATAVAVHTCLNKVLEGRLDHNTR